MKVRSSRTAFITLLCLVFFVFLFTTAYTQEAKVNKHKIEREQRKKDKKAKKEYDKAVKQHKKNQSKDTRTMMKKTDRQAKKNSPVKPSKGKKCK